MVGANVEQTCPDVVYQGLFNYTEIVSTYTQFPSSLPCSNEFISCWSSSRSCCLSSRTGSCFNTLNLSYAPTATVAHSYGYCSPENSSWRPFCHSIIQIITVPLVLFVMGASTPVSSIWFLVVNELLDINSGSIDLGSVKGLERDTDVYMFVLVHVSKDALLFQI